MPYLRLVATSVVFASLAAAATATAAPSSPHDDVVVIGPPQPGDAGYRRADHAAGPYLLYVNRCVGGCPLTAGTRQSDSSATNTSSIATIDTVVPAFPWGDTTWAAIMQCVRDAYLPYNVEVTDVDPGTTRPHVEMVVGGHAADIGLDEPPGGRLLGIAPATGTCSLGGNWIAFTFAASHANDPIELCATVAHEAGHVFGLEHVFECSDPMTYISGCGQKFFRNLPMRCGTDSATDCQCGGSTSNTFTILRRNVGAGADVPPPTVAITVPAPGPVQPGFSLFVTAIDRRGVHDLEVLVNGWSWLKVPGVWAKTSPYQLDLPAEIPPGVMDIEVKACGDTGACASATVTVTEGTGCTTVDTCLPGQACTDGRCAWGPPSVALGDPCTYDQACVSGLCGDVGGGDLRCTEACQGPPNDFCPDGYTCTAGPGDSGVCRSDALDDSGGCCAVATTGAPLPALGLGAAVALLVTRRRRRG